MQTPSIGRIVHYVHSHSSEHIAAMITSVDDDESGVVGLLLFLPKMAHQSTCSSSYDARMSPGTWHYPEHVGTVQWHESEEIPAPRTAGE